MKQIFNPKGPFVLHILTYYDRSEKAWCAHCLDFNLVEDGSTSQEAEDRLASTVASYLSEVSRRRMKEDEIYAPAPQFFWDLIAKAQRIKVRRQTKRFPLPYLSFRARPLGSHEAAAL